MSQRAEKEQEEADSLKKNKAYRRYAAAVERALGLFDTALQEWADYISFLGRLQKALQSQPEGISVIPEKEVVAKRLAQCLNPTLPSGVHQKTFEVYALVFALQGQERLSHDLWLYLPGISSTLTFASLSVRPLFLSLIEDHVLHLPAKALRPSLKALILSLLPGLEEESSEDFDRVLHILKQLKTQFSASNSTGVFWQSLFLSSITCPARRLGVIAYLSRYLPRLGPNPKLQAHASDGAPAVESEDMIAVIDPEPGLLVRCFATGLLDKQILVQRSFLDLLVTHIPLNSPFYQSGLAPHDTQILVGAALTVVLRRDMSLNRRLWSWFLGGGKGGAVNGHDIPTSPEETTKQIGDMPGKIGTQGGYEYFTKYGLDLVVASLMQMIGRQASSPSERAQPLRIALSLMDLWDIGGPAIAAIFTPLLRSVYTYVDKAPSKEAIDEVARSANVFFDGVESNLIWSEILHLADHANTQAGQAEQTVMDDLHLAKFILTKFNVQEEEMLELHIPMVMLALICTLKEKAMPPLDQPNVPVAVRDQLLDIVDLLAVLLPDRLPEKYMEKPRVQPKPGTIETLEVIRKFYQRTRSSLNLPDAPFSPVQLESLILQHIVSIIVSSLRLQQDHLMERFAHTLVVLTRKVRRLDTIIEGLITTFCDTLKTSPTESLQSWKEGSTIPKSPPNPSLSTRDGTDSMLPQNVVLSISSILLAVCAIQTDDVSSRDLVAITSSLVENLWKFLIPPTRQYHIEAVQHIWNLHALCEQYHTVESTISSLMIKEHLEVEQFAAFWNYSLVLGFLNDEHSSSMVGGPLMLVIDNLMGPTQDSYYSSKEWLQSLPSLQHVLRIAFQPLLQSTRALIADNYDSNFTAEACASFERAQRVVHLQSDEQLRQFAMEESSWALEFLTEFVPSFTLKPTIQALVSQICLQFLSKRPSSLSANITQCAISMLQVLLQGSFGKSLIDDELERTLIGKLEEVLSAGDGTLQKDLINILRTIVQWKLRFRLPQRISGRPGTPHSGTKSKEKNDTNQWSSDAGHGTVGEQQLSSNPVAEFVTCLKKGILSAQARPVIDRWILLFCDALPLFESLFQILIGFTECLCKEIALSFDKLRSFHSSSSVHISEDLDKSIISLLKGLEFLLTEAHQRLKTDEAQSATAKSPDLPQGFFGTMVSGGTSSEVNQLRNAAANNHLTVILCFQDSVRELTNIWGWETFQDPLVERTASFQHTAAKLRGRSRRILENLVGVEPLECLETLVELWVRDIKSDSDMTALPVLELVQTLNALRPRITMPALFNSIYSRTHASVLDKDQRSTLSTNLSESELVAFLVHYTSSLEDDLLEEIWVDCTTFLRDVLGNPMPHRHVLSRLLNFIAVIGQKMENTNFGEEWKMKRELGDLFVRLLTANFTIKPAGVLQETVVRSNGLKNASSHVPEKQLPLGSDDVVDVLCEALPIMNSLLGDSDRLLSVTTTISSQLIAPAIRSKVFPRNVPLKLLLLLQNISRVPNSAKLWKKEVQDAINDHRFFQTDSAIADPGWLPLLRQVTNNDKTLMNEILSRLAPPTSAGLMFGVGASAARLDADKKTQLNLRRVATIVVAGEEDAFADMTENFRTKLEELFMTTRVSSPSSVTRADVFMLVRALVLRTTSARLAPIWPSVGDDLRHMFGSIMKADDSGLHNGFSLLQAAKLLDLLLVLQPDEFQLHEWVFVTDTIDAIYPPDGWNSRALIDEVAQNMKQPSHSMVLNTPGAHETPFSIRLPWLCNDATRNATQDEILDKLLRPFFGQLSIHAFESIYRLGDVDRKACVDDLMADLFNEETMASS